MNLKLNKNAKSGNKYERQGQKKKHQLNKYKYEIFFMDSQKKRSLNLYNSPRLVRANHVS